MLLLTAADLVGGVMITGIPTAVISFFRHRGHSMGFHLPWQDVGTTWLGTVVDPVSCWDCGSCGEKQH